MDAGGDGLRGFPLHDDALCDEQRCTYLLFISCSLLSNIARKVRLAASYWAMQIDDNNASIVLIHMGSKMVLAQQVLNSRLNVRHMIPRVDAFSHNELQLREVLSLRFLYCFLSLGQGFLHI